MALALILAGVFVHLILMYSIFDVYYTSPIITTGNAFSSNVIAPAKRVIIISADGLRFDTFNKNPEKSPFLHSIIRNREGVSGLSLSHVPTESRPGHVAIFAGFTEDVSAVAKGWKKNPVQFDSVFNRSSESWMWGSPDIMDLFTNLPNVNAFSYSPEEEDFASDDASKLDTWVIDSFESFLRTADIEKSKNLSERIKKEKTVIFLHLLGIDTNGHGHKPYSSKYIDNIKVVDEGIERIQKTVANFFDDNATAWIFTSDHGMTNWGSHGAGSNDEVLTPFVAWGAGIRKGGARNTIAQIDLAPLVASLVGICVPANSMGVLPVQVLEEKSQSYNFRASFANFLQLKEQVVTLRNAKSNRLWFRQFPDFGDKAMMALEKQLVNLAKARRFSAANSLFSDNASALKSAIFYYHRYDQSFLGASVSSAFVAWVLLVVSFLCRYPDEIRIDRRLFTPSIGFSILLGSALILSKYCDFSAMQTIYVLMPIYLLSLVENSASASDGVKMFLAQFCDRKIDVAGTFNLLVKPMIILVVLCIVVCIFVLSFIDRRFVSLIFLLLIGLPNTYESPTVLTWARTWRISCILLLPFPFLPPVGVSSFLSLCIFPPMALAAICLCITRKELFSRISSLARCASFILIATTVFIAGSNLLFEKQNFIVRSISWSTIPISFCLPFFVQPFIVDRLFVFVISLFVPYSLLSVCYESVFILLLLPILFLFLRFEFSHLSDVDFINMSTKPAKSLGTKHRISFVEIRRSIVCICFILCSLFGTGNFASINSFNPSSLRLFISVFSPFTMVFLLILKLLIPAFIVTIIMASIVRFDFFQIQRMCCIVLIVTDLMSICFFHQLKDDGSWLEIGLSISQFVVSMVTSLAILLLLFLSSKMMRMELYTIWNRTSLLNMKESVVINNSA